MKRNDFLNIFYLQESWSKINITTYMCTQYLNLGTRHIEFWLNQITHSQGIPKPWTKVDFEGGCNDEDDPLRPQGGGCRRVININANSASLGCQLSLFQSTKYTTTAAA